MSESSMQHYRDQVVAVAARQAKRIRDAHFAVCDCGTRIMPNHYWQLSHSVWLHTHGSCTVNRVRYFEYA